MDDQSAKFVAGLDGKAALQMAQAASGRERPPQGTPGPLYDRKIINRSRINDPISDFKDGTGAIEHRS
jgi:hypothetical protein